MTSRIFQPKPKIIIPLLLPGVLIFIFSVIIPVLLSFKYSFYSWSGSSDMTFVGFQNYLDLMQDRNFYIALENNLKIVLFCIIGQIGFAFIVSSLLQSKKIRFKNFHQTVIFFPIVLSAVVLGLLWGLIYNKDIGVLNTVLHALHLDALIRPWLDDPKMVIYSISVPLIWQYIGYYMVILLAGMQGIPDNIYEVADIDGATGWRRALYITLPLLKNTIKVTIMLCIAGNMVVFDHIFVMTGGGPGKSSMVLAQYAYNNSFGMFKMGYGSTISIGIMLISLVMILITRVGLRGGRNEA